MDSSTASDIDQNGPTDIVRRYAGNSPFRAAEAHELVNENNPFRRSVRPDDLDWLDYGGKFDRADVLLLSGLLGHRMLRNIYDADLLFLPTGGARTPSGTDGNAFYTNENRVRGHQAGVVLENHLFSFLPGERRDHSESTVVSAVDHVGALFAERLDRPGRVFEVAAACRNRSEALTFALLQLTATTPAANAAVARNLVGDYDTVHPGLRGLLLADYSAWAASAEAYRTMLGGCGLLGEPTAYWQFYLSSSLARGNHLHLVSRSHERFGEFLGAWVYKRLDEAVTSAAYGQLVSDVFGADPAYFTGLGTDATELGELVKALLTPLADRFGPDIVRSFDNGFDDAHTLAGIWDEDLAVQLDWADRLDEYKEKAEKLHYKLESEKIEVDLETFVESSEETSTTHVHDDHRLVVIEVGQMHFWNNVGKMIPMTEGDKLLIPATRLHGSVVLSGSCTYHQPVIPEDLLRTV
nr:hypothetical protein [Kibdelosporangium sp. MJ126-NF4]CEL17991.1 Putative non-ribosomal peptide synthetase [Kibdelosporangium sp. MJ126-NF4]CTQ90781.1 Putative non-ribosomal peptide synthetase [Kibdelosporangium sp. MJ126-NF4]